MTPSATHLVLIPSYDSGPRLATTVEEVLRFWSPVWIVVDGSTDASADPVRALAARDPRVRVIDRPANGGKGAAIATGLAAALAAGFTHVLTMDSDGQHPADLVPVFMESSRAQPDALVLGRPVFGPEAPAARRQGRKLSVGLAWLEILGPGIDDPLFGFRVYPAAALARAFASTRWGRRFDFDHEAAVRMFWDGTPTLNLPAPCRYLAKSDGGVSHFHYVRDNLVLIWLHLRLLAELLPLALAAGLEIAAESGEPRRPRGSPAMKRLLVLSLLCWALPFADAAAPAADPAHDPGWQDLFRRLAPSGDRQVSFTEERYFPFRREPIVLAGVVRLRPDRGLSLEYRAPEPRIVIVDAEGVLVREAGGQRAAPDDHRAQAATAALGAVLRFDPAELARDFELRGDRQPGGGWILVLTPRDPALAASLHSIAVRGSRDQLAQIELNAGLRIEIILGPALDGVRFTAADLARYFR